MPKVNARFFTTPAKFRAWLAAHHRSANEIYVGFYRKDSGKRGITYAEALDEALCYGWIDGVRHALDHERYTNRFTPRRPKSAWSAVNIAKVKALIAGGRMAPAGLAAYEARNETKARADAAARREAKLDAASMRRFKANRAAWTYFASTPAGYQRLVALWIMSAKQDATRQRRLNKLIECSAAGTRIPQLAP